MKLTAIFKDDLFLGVVPTDAVTEICKEEGITDYKAIDNVHVAQNLPDNAKLIYRSPWDVLIDDLNGHKGHVVYTEN